MIIYQYCLSQMDLLMSMVSIVKDINAIDKEYKNLNLQLKYTLEKATRILNRINTKEQNFGIAVLKNTMSEAEKLSKKLDDLLNAQQIAMKDKIRLSMPFNQTKPEIIKVIETLEKVVSDFKQELSDETKIETKNESRQLGVKRKISEPQICVRTVQRQVVSQLSAKQIDEHLQEIYEMGPTIKEDEYHFSEGKKKQRQIQFTVSIFGSDEIMKVLQSQSLAKTKIKLKQYQIPQEKTLYTVARLNFQKCYSKIKAITKDIDRISTKAHFHFIFKKVGQETAPSQISRVSSSHKRNCKNRSSGSQKAEQDIFFSFPADEKESSLEFRLVGRKQDSSKIVYIKQTNEWVKVEQSEIQIINGDQLAAFINPQTKQPSMYFQLKFEVHN